MKPPRIDLSFSRREYRSIVIQEIKIIEEICQYREQHSVKFNIACNLYVETQRIRNIKASEFILILQDDLFKTKTKFAVSF
jgi:hypothetical protein